MNNTLKNVLALTTLLIFFGWTSSKALELNNVRNDTLPEFRLSENFKLEKQAINQWVVMEKGSIIEGMKERCNVHTVQEALKDIDNVEVVSVKIESGKTDFPDACHVVLEETSPGGKPVTINVWAPLEWNGRFMGCVGGGTRTFHMYEILGRQNRIAMPSNVLRNGFATANTDGGVPGEAFVWGFDEQTKGVDFELILNLAYRSTHSMTVTAKKVITALYGRAPEYSYLQGASGGGRQSLMEAQMYTNDYDGIWAVDPAINWTQLFSSLIWPLAVMNSEHHIISPDKLDFYCQAAIKEAGSKRDFIETVDRPDFNPYDYVGQQAGDGIVTEDDAKIMKLIFDGPKTTDGHFLWYGFRPGTHFWNTGGIGGSGTVTYSADENGKFIPVLNSLAAGYHSAWLERDLSWDGKDLDYKKFEEMFKTSLRDFYSLQCNDPDLTGLRDSGTKLLLSHAINDDVIPSDGTLDYYKNVVVYMGGEEKTLPYLRFFFSPGGGHTTLNSPGLSFTLADGMIALMKWVEEGNAPETIPAVQYDFTLNANIRTGNVAIYHPGVSEVASNVQETEAWTKKQAQSSFVNTSARFNRNSIIKDILKDEQGAVILKESIGSLLDNPQMESAKGMSIGSLEEMMPMPDLKKRIGEAIKKLEELK